MNIDIKNIIELLLPIIIPFVSFIVFWHILRIIILFLHYSCITDEEEIDEETEKQNISIKNINNIIDEHNVDIEDDNPIRYL